MSKYVGENGIFFVNDNKLYKVKIGTQKESEPEKLEFWEKVEEDGKPHIDAAIVRIMKSRNVLDHNNLIVEVTKLLHVQFLTNPTDVKKRIKCLIEWEYLERDDIGIKKYRYVA